MTTSIELDKLEGARRHIETGVTMFFERKDFVVVYTVAWTAYNVLSDLCHSLNIERQIEDSPELKALGFQEKVLKAFRQPRNFFQHGGARGKNTIKLSAEMAPLMLLLAGELFQKIDSEAIWHYQVLKMWFSVKYMQRASARVREHLAALPHEVDFEDFDLFLDMVNKKFSA